MKSSPGANTASQPWSASVGPLTVSWRVPGPRSAEPASSARSARQAPLCSICQPSAHDASVATTRPTGSASAVDQEPVDTQRYAFLGVGPGGRRRSASSSRAGRRRQRFSPTQSPRASSTSVVSARTAVPRTTGLTGMLSDGTAVSTSGSVPALVSRICPVRTSGAELVKASVTSMPSSAATMAISWPPTHSWCPAYRSAAPSAVPLSRWVGSWCPRLGLITSTSGIDAANVALTPAVSIPTSRGATVSPTSMATSTPSYASCIVSTPAPRSLRSATGYPITGPAADLSAPPSV